MEAFFGTGIRLSNQLGLLQPVNQQAKQQNPDEGPPRCTRRHFFAGFQVFGRHALKERFGIGGAGIGEIKEIIAVKRKYGNPEQVGIPLKYLNHGAPDMSSFVNFYGFFCYFGGAVAEE